MSYYSGGSGASNIAGGFATYPALGVEVTASQTVSPEAQGHVFTNATSTCSTVAFRFDVDTAPGAGATWRFYLESADGGVQSQLIACHISNTATSCSGNGALAVAVGESINVNVLDFNGSPANSPARWDVRCTAP